MDNLLALMTKVGGGLSVRQLQEKLGEGASVRNVQRWLAELVKVGKVEKVGGQRGRGVLYRIAGLTGTGTVTQAVGEFEATGWVISPESAQALKLVSQPLFRRKPVGYECHFLDSYEPNKTYYLPEHMRKHLYDLGSQSPQQPAGTYTRELLPRLLIDLSWNSSRLEGNTYSLLETEKLILQQEAPAGKKAEETQMILNHKAAIEFLVEAGSDIGFNTYTIRNLHALLSDNLLPNPEACGRLRTIPVQIGNTSYVPTAIPGLIQELFGVLLGKAEVIEDPFEQSFFALAHLAYLQAFDDVNKRVSRLAANIPMIRNQLCPLSFIDMPQDLYVKGLLAVYEMNHVGPLMEIYIHAYEHSVQKYAVVRQSLGEPDTFRLTYRQQIMSVVSGIVTDALGRDAAVQRIRKESETVPEKDSKRFVEVVETELQSLNEGNMARYRIRPSQYRNWREQW